jgi:5'-3' exonuclease
MLDSFDVEHIIAPYEADPQLAHLCRTGYVNAILTMDSDLLAFDCPHIIFQRYDFNSLVYIQHASLFTKVPDKSQLLNLTSFTPTMFRHMCILSGCDYVENMSRFGIKSAYKSLKSGSTVEQIVKSHLGSRNTLEVSNYMTKFQIAEAGFLYQIVYDPKSKSCIRLNALPDKLHLTKEELSLLGTISNMKDSSRVNSAQQKQKDSRVEKEYKNQTKEPAVVPDTYKSNTIAGLTKEEEEEEICPSLSTTKDEEEEEEELLSTPAEVNLPSIVKVDNKSESKIPDNNYKGTKTPLQDTTNNNKMTAHELASSFKQKSTSSFIRQKSVLGSLKKIQSTNTRQTTLVSFFGRHKQEKKRKPEEMSKSDKSNETVYALLNNKRFK